MHAISTYRRYIDNIKHNIYGHSDIEHFSLTNRTDNFFLEN